MLETKEVLKKEAGLEQGVERTRPRKVYTPAVDIIERKDDIVLIADMPGVDEKNMDITLEKNVLSIYGKVDAAIPENHRLFASEYGIGDYERSFNISDLIDKNRIQAAFKNGVLKLVLPKAEEVKTRRIEVTVG